MKPLTAEDLIVGGKYMVCGDICEYLYKSGVAFVFRRLDRNKTICLESVNGVTQITAQSEPNQTTMNTEAKWNPETQSGTYPDKVHHGEMKVKPNNTMNTDYTEQPFNLETALKHPEWVRTRDGREIDFWKHYPDRGGIFVISFIISDGDRDSATSDGCTSNIGNHKNDLILRVPYRVKWANIYYKEQKAYFYDSEEEANEKAASDRVACVPVKIPAND